VVIFEERAILCKNTENKAVEDLKHQRQECTYCFLLTPCQAPRAGKKGPISEVQGNKTWLMGYRLYLSYSVTIFSIGWHFKNKIYQTEL
jgi:hypothetical protein